MYFYVIFWYFFVIFGVFMTAILEWVCQSCNFNNASPFLLCSFESIDLSINQSIYLPTNLSTLSYLTKFSKSIFISQNSVIYQNRLSRNSDSNKGFMRTFLGPVDIYCHQTLLSYIHKRYFLSLCFKWSQQKLKVMLQYAVQISQ